LQYSLHRIIFIAPPLTKPENLKVEGPWRSSGAEERLSTAVWLSIFSMKVTTNDQFRRGIMLGDHLA